MSGTITSVPNLALPVAVEQGSLPGTLRFPAIMNSFMSPLLPSVYHCVPFQQGAFQHNSALADPDWGGRGCPPGSASPCMESSFLVVPPARIYYKSLSSFWNLIIV